jgi:carbon monoxide dehydrogenase subunit G
MKLEGSYDIPAPRDVVWQKLMDPNTLAKSLPGCEKMDPNGAGRFDVVLKVGIGAIRGSYAGQVEIADAVPLQGYRMKVEGKGTGGFLKGEGTIALSDATEGVRIHYSGNAEVGGMIASVGQRLVQAGARQIVNQFFQAFAKQVQNSPAM